MTPKKLSIESETSPIKTPKKPKVSRRARLPSGISYHDTPAGLKYRIRIRSAKKLKTLGADLPIDESFDDLKAAEQRLLKLKYKTDEVKTEFYAKAIAQLNAVNIEKLLEVHFDKYYSKLEGAKEHKSRMNVISRTMVPVEDARKMMFLGTSLSMVDFNKNEIPFGQVPIVEFEKHLQAYIDKRKEKVKNQTIVNDLMFLSTALQSAHSYFTNIPKYKNPLELVNFKTLKDQITYKEKRLRPEVRAAVETIIIESSRVEHYHDMFVFLCETGVRISEALTILKKDVDLEKNIIFLVSKKNEERRYLGIVPKLREILVRRMANLKATERIFPNSGDTYQGKITGLKEKFAEAGISFSWHMLRHTFISNGQETKSVAELMNTTDIRTFQHFKEQYMNPLRAEQIAIKIANAQTLTAQEMQTAVGHKDPQITLGTYSHAREMTTEEKLQKDNRELRELLSMITQRLAGEEK